MLRNISPLPSFALSLKEYLSVALETLSDEAHAETLYWFIHPEKTEYWDSLNLSATSKPFHTFGSQRTLSKLEFSHLKDHLLEINEVRLLNQNHIKNWNIYSDESLIIIPVYLLEERLASIVIMDVAKNLNLDVFKKKLSLFIRHMQLTLRSLHSEALAFIDDLTGLYNARAFHILMEEALKRSTKLNSCFSLLMIDIDDLKKINDGFGHLCGNIIIRDLAHLMKKSLRSRDHVCRYGGDEFAVILENSSSSMAHDIVSRMKSLIEHKSFQMGSRYSKITISTGYATFPHHASTLSGLVQIADEAMYFNKTHKKRNLRLSL